MAGAYPFGQRPSEARPPQQMKDVKVSAIRMQAMRDVLLQMPVGSSASRPAPDRALRRRSALRLPAERGGRVRDQAGQREVIPADRFSPAPAAGASAFRAGERSALHPAQV